MLACSQSFVLVGRRSTAEIGTRRSFHIRHAFACVTLDNITLDKRSKRRISSLPNLSVDSAVENILAVGNPVANWGHFIRKCWRERSTGVIVAVNQFTNEM